MFIVLTGGDKCGKTTQCGLLASRLREHGLSVFETGVPNYNSPTGKALEGFLKDARLSPGRSEEHLRTAYEALHMVDKQLVADSIAAAEQEGQIVVCSRWTESAAIYAEASGHREEWHERLLAKLPQPDLMIVIDIDDATYWSRASRGGNLDMYEANQDFQCQVRGLFRKLSIHTVYGSAPEQEVADDIWKIVVKHCLGFVGNGSKRRRSFVV